jgi:hypothetical protein
MLQPFMYGPSTVQVFGRHFLFPIDQFSPRNENLNLLVRIKFLNLLYIYNVYLNKN